MADIDEIVATFRSVLEPAGPGGDVAFQRKHLTRRYANDAHVFFPGVWFMGGHHNGAESIAKLWEAAGLIWPGGTRLFRNHFFVGEDTFVGEWWSRNSLWNGSPCCNSGVGRLSFRGKETIDHHEITDSEYFQEVHRGWREFLGPELGRHLPRWHDRERPFYPDPRNNDWACEHATSDGRERAPAAMRERLARAIEWWSDPRKADHGLFDDGVDVFFQGRLWPLGGHHRGRQGLARVRELAEALWPGPQRVVKTCFWADETRTLVEWFREAETWKGQAFREGGFTVWDWRGDRVEAVRSYVDTGLHAELLEGWREQLGAGLGSALPNWPEPPERRYPQTDAHE
jgi:ketosteroid isomerase-like protein